MTDADKKAKRLEIVEEYQKRIRVYRESMNRTIWRAHQDFNEHRQRLQARREAALEALEKEAKLP